VPDPQCGIPSIVLAGAEGFEPTHAGIKTRCLNHLATPLFGKPGLVIRDWGFANSRRTTNHQSPIPSRPSSASSRGERCAPAAVHARRSGGNADSAAPADSLLANSTKQPLPDPVRRGRPIRASAANAASTAGSRRRSTGSNALPSPAPETKSDIVAGGAFRVNSGAWNSAAVQAWTPGSASTYQ